MKEFVLSGQLLADLEAGAAQENLPLADFVAYLLEKEQENRLLKAAISHFPQASFFIFDHQKRFIYADGEGLRNAQLLPQDFIGHTLAEVFPPEIAQRDEPHLDAALQGKTNITNVEHHEQYHRVATAPILNQQGEVIAGLVISTNITALKIAEQSARANADFAESLTNTIPEMIYIYDLVEESNIFTNPQVEALLGFTQQQIKQMGMYLIPQLIHPDDVESVRRQYAKARSRKDGAIWEHEYRMRNADGNWRWIRARETPFLRDEEGLVKQILGVGSDITEQKKAEKQALDLILQREKTRLIATFIQNSVHQFRTPLSVISTSLHLLETNPANRQQRVERIREEIEQIAKLVDDLATIIVLDSEPTASYSHMRVNDALRHLKVDFQERCDLKNIRIVLDLTPNLPSLLAQAANFQLALQKMMENALLYTESGGQITLSSRLVGEEIMVEIQDTGAGIADEEIPHIFERFYRGKGWQYTRGFGLGLSIVQKVVQLHSWRITVESQVSEGTSFKIWLPKDTFGS